MGGVHLRALIAAGVLVASIGGCGSDPPGPAAPTVGDRIFMLGVPRSDRGTVDGVFLYTMDTATGKLVRQDLPHLGIGDPLHFLDVSGSRLVYFGDNGTTFAIDLALEEPPVRLGPSLYFVPSTTDGRVWLQGGPRSSPHPARYLSLKEVTVDGRVVVDGRSTNPPCPGPGVLAAVAEAVLCQSRGGLIAANPRTGRAIGGIPGSSFPLATGGDLVASCGEPCPQLYISDPAAGTRFRLEPRPSFTWEAGYSGAFSPNAQLLAVPVVPSTPVPDTRDGTRRVALVDVSERSVEVIHGSRIRQGGRLAFSSAGDRLLFITPGRRVMAYDVGSGRLKTVGSSRRIDVYDLTAG
jgi:hypothetical protein